ncbi:hypothetical protein [Massilibacterium senegalense]|uniref:hypothetical protein n=1 Tax=Massilibacterium senegalense TaxID=1632858 RepID=UPI000780B24D|nr:hypothetical protein [Massilibacterium senegalense]
MIRFLLLLVGFYISVSSAISILAYLSVASAQNNLSFFFYEFIKRKDTYLFSIGFFTIFLSLWSMFPKK